MVRGEIAEEKREERREKREGTFDVKEERGDE